MDIGSIFLILGLLVLVGLFISRPFFERGSKPVSQAEHDQSALMAERDQILNTLQELDFDASLGKIHQADYQVQRLALVQQGAQVLRQLDAYEVEIPQDDPEKRLETVINARRAETLRNGAGLRLVAASPDDNLEVLIANRRRERNEKAAGFCPQCGNPVQKSDLFCPKCGTTLA